MKLFYCTVPALLLAVHGANGAEDSTKAAALLRRENKEEEMVAVPDNNSRQLQASGNFLFGTSTYCHKIGGSGSSYVTKDIYRFLASFHGNHGDLPGTCPFVCADLCDHQQCNKDLVITETTCDCITPTYQCGNNTVCNNDICECQKGFQGNPLVTAGSGCTDINECGTASLNNCGPNTACTNTPGSFTCACLNGYAGNPASPTGCTDENECAANTAICGSNGVCDNTVGGYICRCNRGYVWDSPPKGICVDINECPTTNCGPSAVCNNLPGTVNCTCLAGYSGTPPTVACSDTNECAVTPTICGSNASCNNTVGSYFCACNNGFEGTPPTCSPNACTRANVTCGANTFCNTATGSPVCACKIGFTGDQKVNCTDVDECATVGTCPSSSNCFNTPGGFFCGIKPFFPCPTKEDSTCSPGLTCNPVSRSDPTYACCASSGPCTSAGTAKCCNDAYRENEPCPSTSNDDCEGSLQCGRTTFDSTFRCCKNTIVLIGVRFCS